MSSSIHNIVTIINSSLSGLVKGGDWQAVASNVRRGKETMPAIAEKHAGIDDKFPLRAYHKLGTLITRLAPGSGYGKSTGDPVNTYTNALVVFLNRNQCKLYPDELLLHIQANIPETIVLAPYTRVALNITTTQLDSETVFNQEYENTTYKLGKEQYLFKISYTVETTFKKGCFKTCPQN